MIVNLLAIRHNDQILSHNEALLRSGESSWVSFSLLGITKLELRLLWSLCWWWGDSRCGWWRRRSNKVWWNEINRSRSWIVAVLCYTYLSTVRMTDLFLLLLYTKTKVNLSQSKGSTRLEEQQQQQKKMKKKLNQNFTPEDACNSTIFKIYI